MYDTRDAAQNWEAEYSEFMESIGFKRGIASPCVFNHPERNMKAVIHGDDFILSGDESNLDWFRENGKKKSTGITNQKILSLLS